ncbi:MAG: hypothetical protein AAGG51_02260 [Cyanobacteria bacterium P01_G01_bin.54]
MKYPDEIDFYYVLEPHGWSTCYINIEGSIFEMGPTHVFFNPIELLLDAFTSILKGGNRAEFKWDDEPGEYRWTIVRNKEQKHKINVSITNCLQLNSKDNELKLITLEFEVKIKLFCICILKQMEKIQELMTDSSFKKYRVGEFPYVNFKEFKLNYEQIYLQKTK